MRLLFCLLIVIGLLSSLFFAYEHFLVLPYKEFRAAERRARPKFEELNYVVFTKLPPPANVEKIKTYQSNAETEHGFHLIYEYSYKKGDENNIRNYYKNLLIQDGWNEDNLPSFADVLLHKNRACVRINFIREDYELVIWSDFLDQDFSPDMPPLWL